MTAVVYKNIETFIYELRIGYISIQIIDIWILE